MKKILLILICLLFARMASAQDNQLALDEHNKYVYYEVVDLPGISADSIHRNSNAFVEITYPKSKSKQISSAGILVKDKFLIYSPIAKHESGEITYTLNIECKDSKYRYWLADFVFTPYERNRYSVYVPVNGINIPLESAITKVSQKELNGYLEQTGAFCKQLGIRLKQYMVEDHHLIIPDKQPAKKIVTDKW
jgi:hypothetical protein